MHCSSSLLYISTDITIASINPQQQRSSSQWQALQTCAVVESRKITVFVWTDLCTAIQQHHHPTRYISATVYGHVCRDLPVVLISYVAPEALCHTEKATPARHRPERQYSACANRRKQCSPNETKSLSNPTPPRKIQNDPTNGHTPRGWQGRRTHVSRTQECALTRLVTRRVTTQYLHTQNVTTRRRCVRNDNQDSPRELLAHRANGIAADQGDYQRGSFHKLQDCHRFGKTAAAPGHAGQHPQGLGSCRIICHGLRPATLHGLLEPFSRQLRMKSPLNDGLGL